MNVYKLVEYNYEAEFVLRDEDLEEPDGPIITREPVSDDDKMMCRIECDTLNVTASGFFWRGYIKHTDFEIETETVSIPDEWRKSSPGPQLAIIVDGGLVQAIVSDNEAFFEGVSTTVVDYDTEGADREDIVTVRQPDGSLIDAVVTNFGAVEKTAIDIQAPYKEAS